MLKEADIDTGKKLNDFDEMLMKSENLQVLMTADKALRAMR